MCGIYSLTINSIIIILMLVEFIQHHGAKPEGLRVFDSSAAYYIKYTHVERNI